MASPATALRRRTPGKHAGEPLPVTPADVLAYFFLKASGKHALVLVSRNVKYSKPAPCEIGRPVAARAEEPAPVTEVEEIPAIPATSITDEYGYFEIPQPAMA